MGALPSPIAESVFERRDSDPAHIVHLEAQLHDILSCGDGAELCDPVDSVTGEVKVDNLFFGEQSVAPKHPGESGGRFGDGAGGGDSDINSADAFASCGLKTTDELHVGGSETGSPGWRSIAMESIHIDATATHGTADYGAGDQCAKG